MTADWYRAVFERVPPASHLLDIGIGTGSALLANADLLVARDLRVTGVDIDGAYIARCRAGVAAHQLTSRIDAHCESITDHHGGPYDIAYFSGSFMLLPDPPATLRHTATLLRPGGRFYFTQTFEHQRAPLLEIVKPLLRLLTTIDFGRITYEDAFRRTLDAGGVTLETLDVLHPGPRRSSVLAVARMSNPTDVDRR